LCQTEAVQAARLFVPALALFIIFCAGRSVPKNPANALSNKDAPTKMLKMTNSIRKMNPAMFINDSFESKRT
jgi:hypothetical protein